MNIEEARRLLEEEDDSDPLLALDAIATILRSHFISDRRMMQILKLIETVMHKLDGETK